MTSATLRTHATKIGRWAAVLGVLLCIRGAASNVAMVGVLASAMMRSSVRMRDCKSDN